MSTTKEYGKGNITSTKIILGRRMVVEGGWKCQNNLIYSNLKWLSWICSAASKQLHLTKIWNCGIEASKYFIIEWPNANTHRAPPPHAWQSQLIKSTALLQLPLYSVPTPTSSQPKEKHPNCGSSTFFFLIRCHRGKSGHIGKGN